MECTRGSERAALSLSPRVRKLLPALSRLVARLRWLTLRYSCLVCTSGVADIASLKGDWFKVLGLDERCLPLSLSSFLPGRKDGCIAEVPPSFRPAEPLTSSTPLLSLAKTLRGSVGYLFAGNLWHESAHMPAGQDTRTFAHASSLGLDWTLALFAS